MSLDQHSCSPKANLSRRPNCLPPSASPTIRTWQTTSSRAFAWTLGSPGPNFSEAELELIRKDLVEIRGLGGYSVTEAIAIRSSTDPEWVIRLLQDRIERAETLESMRDYEAMPFSWDNALQIRTTPDFMASLNGILAWIAMNLDSWVRRKMGADLFAAVARAYDRQVVEQLAKALESGSED